MSSRLCFAPHMLNAAELMSKGMAMYAKIDDRLRENVCIHGAGKKLLMFHSFQFGKVLGRIG